MSARLIKDGLFFPHQSIVLTKEDLLPDFSLTKILNACALHKDLLGKESAVWEIEVHPTTLCNLKCPGCSYATRHDGCIIHTEQLAAILNYYGLLNAKSVFFSGGGDPLMWKDWDNLFSRIEVSNFYFGIATNLYNYKSIKNCINVFDLFQIHVIGHNRQSIRAASGLEMMSVFQNNLSDLFSCRNKNQIVTLKYLITSNNYTSIDDILDYLLSLCGDTVVLKIQQDFLSNHNHASRRMIEYIRERVACHHIHNNYDILLDNLNDTYFNNPIPKRCHFVQTGLYRLIDSHGDVYPCIASTYDRANSLYNISSIPANSNNSLLSDVYLNKELLQRCPLRACRHYRFSSVLESFETPSSFPTYTPVLL